MKPRSKEAPWGSTAASSAEEELETGEPIPEDDQSAAKIPGRRGNYTGRTADRVDQTPPPAPGEGRVVLASAKYLNTDPDPKVDRENNKRQRAEKAEQSKGNGLGFEKGVLNSGVAGGLLAMIGAVVWFVAGLMNDVLFFYPPILFVIGLGAFFKGLTRNE
jgi:hypothetical protein